MGTRYLRTPYGVSQNFINMKLFQNQNYILQILKICGFFPLSREVNFFIIKHFHNDSIILFYF